MPSHFTQAFKIFKFEKSSVPMEKDRVTSRQTICEISHIAWSYRYPNATTFHIFSTALHKMYKHIEFFRSMVHRWY